MSFTWWGHQVRFFFFIPSIKLISNTTNKTLPISILPSWVKQSMSVRTFRFETRWSRIYPKHAERQTAPRLTFSNFLVPGLFLWMKNARLGRPSISGRGVRAKEEKALWRQSSGFLSWASRPSPDTRFENTTSHRVDKKLMPRTCSAWKHILSKGPPVAADPQAATVSNNYLVSVLLHGFLVHFIYETAWFIKAWAEVFNIGAVRGNPSKEVWRWILSRRGSGLSRSIFLWPNYASHGGILSNGSTFRPPARTLPCCRA